MKAKFRKKFFYLQLYCVATTLLIGGLFVFGFASRQKQKFTEIDVERINVVEKDGKLRMVISNAERQHPGIVDGKPFDRKRDSAGMIFFNDKGDEVGVLIFYGDTGKGQYNSFTFDKFRGDQTVALQHFENKEGSYFAGLTFNDQNIPTTDFLNKMEAIKKLPDEEARKVAIQEMRNNNELATNRLIIGRGRNKSALLEMSDAKGKPRINMSVAADGNPKLEFLDETGKVIYSLPEKTGDKK